MCVTLKPSRPRKHNENLTRTKGEACVLNLTTRRTTTTDTEAGRLVIISGHLILRVKDGPVTGRDTTICHETVSSAKNAQR